MGLRSFAPHSPVWYPAVFRYWRIFKICHLQWRIACKLISVCSDQNRLVDLIFFCLSLMLLFGVPSATTPKICCSSYSVSILTTVSLFTKRWSIAGLRYNFLSTTVINGKVVHDSMAWIFLLAIIKKFISCKTNQICATDI